MLTDTAQNFETEKLSDSNLSFSLILNPIEVFSAPRKDLEVFSNTYKGLIFFWDQLNHEKLPRTETAQIDSVLRRATRVNP